MQSYIAALLTLVAIVQCVLFYRLETGETFRAGLLTQANNPNNPSFIIPGQASQVQRSAELMRKVDEEMRGAGIK